MIVASIFIAFEVRGPPHTRLEVLLLFLFKANFSISDQDVVCTLYQTLMFSLSGTT